MPIILLNSSSFNAESASTSEWGSITGTLSNQADLQTELDSKINITEKGAANGVATLDATGKLPKSELPTSAMEYKGTWNASTNTPTLSSGVGTNGDQYLVSVSGTTNLDGISDWEIGDALLFNGNLSIWQKIEGTLTETEILSIVEKTNNITGFELAGGTTTSKALTISEDCTVDQNISTTSNVTHDLVNVTSNYNVNSNNVLNQTTLGSTVLNSSLRNLGFQNSTLNMNDNNISNIGIITSTYEAFGAALHLENGDTSGTFGFQQIEFDDQTNGHKHFIITRHGSNVNNCKIQFIVADGSNSNNTPTSGANNILIIRGTKKVGINEANPVCALDVISTDSGIGFPTLTQTQIDSISTNRNQMVYNSDKDVYQGYVDGSGFSAINIFNESSQFSGSSDTSTLGFKSYYGCTDTTLAFTFTISSADIAKGSTDRYWVFTVKDESGGAATNNITIDTEGGEPIDGALSVSITTNYGSVTLASNGTILFTI